MTKQRDASGRMCHAASKGTGYRSLAVEVRTGAGTIECGLARCLRRAALSLFRVLRPASAGPFGSGRLHPARLTMKTWGQAEYRVAPG